MTAHSSSHHKQPEVARMTVDFPVVRHKQLKAIAALLGVPMKEFILECVIEKLESEELLKSLEEEKDTEIFDRAMDSVKKDGYDTLEEVRRYLGLHH